MCIHNCMFFLPASIGVGWLLGYQQRQGKVVSSVVFYFSGAAPVRGRVLWFGGRWCPVDRYRFDGEAAPGSEGCHGH